MKRLIYSIIVSFVILTLSILADNEKLLTIAERSGYKQTSTSAEVEAFLKELSKMTDHLRIESLTTTYEGRNIPMVIMGDPLPKGHSEKLKDNRPVIYIQANIHAGEVAGKSAVLMLMRDMLHERENDLLRKLILVIVPNFNPDGNDRISKKNRAYISGPSGGVGIRYNSQHLDLNRDYIKMETREVSATVKKIYTKWDPLVMFDMHTTNGSFHKHYMTYLSGKSPYTSQEISDYTWNKFFPAVAKTVRENDDLLTLPYGNFKDSLNPEQGWIAFPDTPRFCSSYVSFRGRFSVLMEAYAHIDFKTRVLSSYSFLRRSLEYIASHANEMKKIAEISDKINSAIPLEPVKSRLKMTLESKIEPAGNIIINSFRMEKRTEKNVYPRYIPIKTEPRTYTVPLMNNFIPTRERRYAAAYILPPGAKNAVDLMRQHGIIVTKIKTSTKSIFKRFTISKLKTSKLPDQGHWHSFVEGDWKIESGEISKGSYLVQMSQPLIRLIAVMLEPDSSDSLLSWNFFDGWIVTQWGATLLPYPVLRLDKIPDFQ